MQRWYTVKVKYTKRVEKNGEEDYKQVTEAFLLPAVSFTDAEAKMTEEISTQTAGDFLVQSMSLTEIAEIKKTEEGGQWYICKIVILEEDDRGRVSKTKQNYMIEGESVKDATKRLEELLSDVMFNYEITTVSRSNIVDVLQDSIEA